MNVPWHLETVPGRRISEFVPLRPSRASNLYLFEAVGRNEMDRDGQLKFPSG